MASERQETEAERKVRLAAKRDYSDKKVLTWFEVRTLTLALAGRIMNEGSEYDAVISIARGGLYSGMLVFAALSNWVAGGSAANRPHVRPSFGVIWRRAEDGEWEIDWADVLRERSRVLFVDDVVCSGRTVAELTRWATERGHRPTFAALHWKPEATPVPKFYVEKTKQWLVYPWEGKEEA